jgi:hypothetical protein
MHTYIDGEVRMKISADETACADERPKDRNEEMSEITWIQDRG